MLGFLGLPGHFELVVIVVVAILIFGRRVPEIIGNMGKAIWEFRRGLKGENDGTE